MKVLRLILILVLSLNSLSKPNKPKKVKKQQKETVLFIKHNPSESPLKEINKEQFTSLLGLEPHNNWGPIELGKYTDDYKNLPKSFDARQKFKNCIHPIRNQMQCNSCWAFAATEVLSDRICIKRKEYVVLSPQYLLSCTNKGCNPATLLVPWQFLKQNGAPTDACVPYVSGNEYRGVCSTACANRAQMRKYFVSEIIQPKTIYELKLELFNNGPIEVGMQIYEDFKDYKSGIYHLTRNAGKMLGGHAVKLIGWGVQNNVEYWIVANSWGERWGERGYFKIQFGQCGIESQAMTGLPK